MSSWRHLCLVQGSLWLRPHLLELNHRIKPVLLLLRLALRDPKAPQFKECQASLPDTLGPQRRSRPSHSCLMGLHLPQRQRDCPRLMSNLIRPRSCGQNWRPVKPYAPLAWTVHAKAENRFLWCVLAVSNGCGRMRCIRNRQPIRDPLVCPHLKFCKLKT